MKPDLRENRILNKLGDALELTEGQPNYTPVRVAIREAMACAVEIRSQRVINEKPDQRPQSQKLYLLKRTQIGGCLQATVQVVSRGPGSGPVFSTVRSPLVNRLTNTSPDGFEWGYTGSGPTALAYSILHESYGSKIADQLHQQFKNQVIAHIPREGGKISAELIADFVNTTSKAGVS